MKKHAFRIGLVVTMLLGLMTLTANAAWEHTNPHPVSDGFAHANEGWTALTADTTALETGKYFIDGEGVTLSLGRVTVTGTVSICLNGNTIDFTNTSAVGNQFSLAEGATLNICDCQETAGKITSSAAYSTSKKVALIHTTESNCTVNLWNGSLSGVKAYNMGPAVQFTGSNNTLNIHGGEIKNNTSTNTGGGAIYFKSAGCTLNMCDGLIDTNSANPGHGGVIYVGAAANINVTGGTISNNKASGSSKYGGVLYLTADASDSEINLTGGTITGNYSKGNGGVICISKNATGVKVNLGGDVKITGNTSDGTHASKLMYLLDNVTTSVTGGTYSDDITNLTPDSGYYKYDNGNGTYTVYVNGYVPSTPSEPDDEEPTGENIHNDGSEWFAYVPGETELEANKNYYLADEVVKSAELITLDKSITLCLHGHSLQSSRGGGGFSVSIPAGVTVNLQDCDVNDTEGTISPATGTEYARGVYVTGTLNMYGGTITGFNGEDGNGAGVQVANGGKMNMYGGVISKNVTTGSGGGVCVNQNGVFNMYDGSITENEAATGGGVYAGGGSSATYAKNNATVNMYGGTISTNTATNGGGVALQRGHLNLSDKAAIDDNTATDGGGVRAYLYCTVTMTGGSIINNKAATGAGISARTSGKITLNDGIIANNAATDSGAAMYLNTNNIVTMPGGHIYGNTNSANDVYGAVYLTSGNTITVTGGSFGLDEEFEPAPNGKIDEAYAAASAIGVVAANDEAIISGGSFYTRYSAKLGADPCFAQSAGAGTITVTGGYFSKTIADNQIGKVKIDDNTEIKCMNYKVANSEDSLPYCVAKVPAVEDKTIQSSVGVGDSLAMIFQITGLPGDVEDYVVTVNDDAATMTKVGDNFKVTYTDVAAKNMDDGITLIITNNDTEVCKVTSSIEDYAVSVLADDTANEELKNAVKYMLNYGAAAQDYFDGEVTLETTYQGLEKYTAQEPAAIAAGKYQGSSVSLKDNIVVNLYFSNDVESVTMGGNALELETKGDYKVAVIDDITLKNAVNGFSFVVDEVEVEDSVEAYVFRAQNLKSADDKLAALCQAMFDFVCSLKSL